MFREGENGELLDDGEECALRFDERMGRVVVGFSMALCWLCAGSGLLRGKTRSKRLT